jgi:hypothetical protein
VIGRGRAAALLAAVAPAAQAHGFGQRYDLPIPLELYLCGAALTVVVSCVMLAFFVRSAPKAEGVPHVDLLATAAGRAIASPGVVAVIRSLAVALYFLLLFAGLFGNQSPFRNIVPVSVWAAWWVGMAYVSALIADLWAIASPLETLFAFAERMAARWRGGPFGLGLSPPARLASWPAAVLYLAFLWMEIAWEGSDSPRAIACVILAYSALTWTGMFLFGREAWLQRGEVFHRVFGVLARFAPMRIVLRDRRVTDWKLRPYAVGLLERGPVAAADIALVLVILAAVSFDGFLETPAWAAIVEPLAPQDAWTARAAGLLTAPLLFFAVYWIFWRLTRLSGAFVMTLVPIAIAYEIAHYVSFLFQAGQYLIPLASDPFGWGWDLFGTRNHFVRLGLVDARLVWIVSVIAIVAGHVAALYLGHVLSMRELADRRAAIRSQGPMLVLMVAYTMLSLWIIAQPIVSSK